MISENVGYIYTFGAFRLDTQEHLLLRNGEPIHLKPKNYDLLLALVRNSKLLLTKPDLMQILWPDSFVEEHNLTVCVFELRRVLREDAQTQYIQTVPRLGYRFVIDVMETAKGNNRLDLSGSPGRAVTHYQLTDADRSNSVAVLPFSSYLKGNDETHLAFALTEALITKLSNLRGIMVRPTSAIRKYLDQDKDPLAAGRELGVTMLLDGSIREVGNKLRVTVQLINSINGVTIWAAKYDEEASNIFDMEDLISSQVTEALELKLTGEEREGLAKHYTKNVQAKQAYTLGRMCFIKKTPELLEKSIEYFTEAAELDPQYALAYVGLARSYLHSIDYNVFPQKYAVLKIKEYLLRALQIDPDIATAKAIQAHIKAIYDWEWEEAEEDYRIALEINDRCSTTHLYYSVYLRHLGRFDDALIHVEKALELNPSSIDIMISASAVLYYARRYDEAIRKIRDVLGIDPNYPSAYFVLGLSYEQKRQYSLALKAYRSSDKFFKSRNAELLACTGRVLAATGEISKAQQVLDRLIELARHDSVSSYYIVQVCAALGDVEGAFQWLAKAVARHDCELATLKVDPRLDELRADMRFQTLLKNVGLLQ